MELESIAPSPGCAARTTDRVVELVALAEAAALPACRRQAPHLPVLVDWSGDPPGVRVSSDSFMEGIDEDNLKKLVRRIFTHPVRIQDPQGLTVASRSLLSNRLQAPGKLELVDGLAVGGALRDRAFAATAGAREPGISHNLAWPCSPACAPYRAGWGAGPGAAPRAGGTASSAT